MITSIYEDIQVRQGNPENKPGSAFSTIIYLPMQPNLEEDNGVNWGADTLNTLQARLVDSAINAMDAAGNADGIGKVLSEIASSLTLDAKNFFSDAAGISDKLKNAGNSIFCRSSRWCQYIHKRDWYRS